MLDEMVEEVGDENVVELMTNDASNYVAVIASIILFINQMLNL